MATASPRCFKCKADQAIIATREGPKKSYCVACFTDFCNRTVRDALFRDCLLPPDVPVVLCVSGGVNSMAMLHLLGVLRQTNMTRGGTGKIFFDFRVLHLTEEDVVAPASEFDAAAIAHTITSFASSPSPVGGIAGAGSLVDPAGIVVKSMRSIIEEIESDQGGRNKDNNIFPLSSRRASTTDLEEEYLIRKRVALSYAAKKYCCSPLPSATTTTIGTDCDSEVGGASSAPLVLMVMAENAVVSCTRALGDLVRGKGAQIPSNSALRSRVQGGAYAMRPLRGLLPKEIIMYCKVSAIPWSTTPTPTTAAGVFGGKSTNRLLQSFISTLMQTFPSTPFNVLNSVTKLAPVSAHNPHRLPTHLPSQMGSRQPSVDTASIASGRSGASASSTQVKVILTKASQANVVAAQAIAQADFDADRSALAPMTCSICDAVCFPPSHDANSEQSHSMLRQVFGVSTSPGSTSSLQVCYGCSALCMGMQSADGVDVVRDLMLFGAHASHDVNDVRKLSKHEIEASIAEFLV